MTPVQCARLAEFMRLFPSDTEFHVIHGHPATLTLALFNAALNRNERN